MVTLLKRPMKRHSLPAMFLVSALLSLTACGAMKAGAEPPPPQKVLHPVLETDVKVVLASPSLAVIPMYDGPGDTYAEIGEVAGSIAATVTGISAAAAVE